MTSVPVPSATWRCPSGEKIEKPGAAASEVPIASELVRMAPETTFNSTAAAVNSAKAKIPEVFPDVVSELFSELCAELFIDWTRE